MAITTTDRMQPDLEFLTAQLSRGTPATGSQHWTARCRDLALFSLFQPIYSCALHRQVGFEGLIRGVDPNQQVVPPGKIFSSDSLNEMLAIDRLCRCLHLANYQNIASREGTWLFLNVNPQIVSEHIPDRPPFMREVLEQYQIPPDQVVIEILETDIRQQARFLDTIKYYREIGCLIAIDDFGAGHSNFNRIWDCHPDFVKLDRSIFVRAMQNKKLRQSIPKLVNLLHEYGCMVLAEGIETYEQATLCMDAEFDLIQGFLFSEPTPVDELCDQSDEIWRVLKDKFRGDVNYKHDERDEYLRPLINAFHGIANTIREINEIKDKCRHMLEMNQVIRFFLLNDDGDQQNANINSSYFHQHRNPAYAPLQKVSAASWYHRQYFRKAMQNIGTVQVTGPYFSTTDAKTCITLSIARELNGQIAVLCCDIEM